MRVFTAPEERFRSDRIKVFLAGSIEMGTADDWQSALLEELEPYNIDVYNPRRKQWDASWEQSVNNPKFKEQVDWEIDAIEDADVVVFYFDPKTKSPITLMELGFVTYRHCRVVVCCPNGFWRKGNVEVVCSRMKENCHNSFAEFVEEIKNVIQYGI